MKKKYRNRTLQLLILILLITTSSCEKEEVLIIKKDPVLNWTSPTDITSGSVLSVNQLNATASVAGTFVYTPAIGTVLSVGENQNLKVDFTPTDEVKFNTATKTVTINVIEKNNPVINWATPTDITSGTVLDIVQLNATASVAGTFVYTPATGTVLSVGENQNLKVDFTPIDEVNYNSATKTVTINVTALASAILYTDPISNLLATTATSGGYITDDGGTSITARGVCWSTNSDPTVNDSKTSDGAGAGPFTSSLSGLLASTTYNVRSYATNSAGTAYGNEISFTTPSATNTSLDGNWLSSGGTGITISGENGSFYSFSSNWQLAANGGFVSIGSLKLKNINQVSTNNWSCSNLFGGQSGGVVVSVTWADDGTITMNDDGSSLTVTSTSPYSGNSSSTTYYKQP